MALIDARTWLEHLTPADCWQLLALSPIGRVGVLVDGAPEIYPVNFVVDERTIVFRTDAGSKLRGLERSSTVCFEADAINLYEQSGWSVLVKGQAEELTKADDVRRAISLPLQFWTFGEKAHWVRVRPVEVTGRRIHRRD
jgi:nitroimidazol reductase NimA-like FMN-containing flavoprotein (pyridoxamine 5'-phosphate oxidase superfamily)